MPGRPKTRAKRKAAAEEAARTGTSEQGSPAGARAGTGARAGAQARTRKAPAKAKPAAKPKAKAKPKPKPKRKPGEHGPRRPRFEPATIEDHAAVVAAVERGAKSVKGADLKPEERVERDESIVAMWALGLQPVTIAERVDLSPQHVQTIIAAHRERRARVPIPASSELLADTLDHLDALIERTSLLASSATIFGPDGETRPNDSVRLGAMRTLAELLASKVGLWQAMGWVSTRPSDEARAQRARDLLRRLLDVLREKGVPQELIDEAASEILTPGQDTGNVRAIEARSRGAA